MALGGLLIVGVVLGVALMLRQGRFAPITVTMWFWVLVIATAMLSDLGLKPVTTRAGLIIGVGLVALAAPSLLSRRRPLPAVTRPARDATLPRVVVCAVVLLALVAVGFLAFRSRLASVTGESFGNLTPTQIRAAQNSAARGGGFAALCSAASPVLACLGVYAGRTYSRLWYALTVLAVAALLDSPARTSVLALGVSTTAFYLYHRRTGAQRRPARGRRHGVLMALAAITLMLYYFNSSGAATGKNAQAAAEYPGFNGPSWLISPVLYLTGGPSALSAALSNGIDPSDHPSSTFVFWRIAHLVNAHVHVPDTLATFVGIPAPFNVYTGFGQLYFDWGFSGVVLLCLLLGWWMSAAHRRALTGSLPWIWLAALLTNVLVSMQLEYRLFLLDVDFQALLGVCVFAVIGRPGRRRWRPSSRPAAARAPKVKISPAAPIPVSELEPAWRDAFGI